MTTCLASTTRIPVEEQTNVTPERYVCGRLENGEGTCDQGHYWSANAEPMKQRIADSMEHHAHILDRLADNGSNRAGGGS